LTLDGLTVLGALTLYADRPRAFAGELEHGVGLLVAAHAATAVTLTLERRRVGHLQIALESNRDIAVAMGVLMARPGITRQEAFDVLRAASQHGSRKLRDLAVEVTETGALDLPPASSAAGPGAGSASSSGSASASSGTASGTASGAAGRRSRRRRAPAGGPSTGSAVAPVRPAVASDPPGPGDRSGGGSGVAPSPGQGLAPRVVRGRAPVVQPQPRRPAPVRSPERT
jgi:hypothetical protein